MACVASLRPCRLLRLRSARRVRLRMWRRAEKGRGRDRREYEQVQKRLARGWNTWDVHSVATQVLLPEGLAIHVGMKHNSTLNGDAFLGDALIGRLERMRRW